MPRPSGGMADTSHSKCDAARRAGSSPASGISKNITLVMFFYFEETDEFALYFSIKKQLDSEKSQAVFIAGDRAVHYEVVYTIALVSHW